MDMWIDRTNGRIETSIYRKPTFTWVYTHFTSFLPSVYKFGLLSTLLFRYFSICSNYKLFHEEVLEFKKIFQRNGYPEKMIDASIYKFLNKMFCQKPPTDDNDPKKEFSIILPFLGPLSDKVQRRIKKILLMES